jgi:AcrR family transcriptional regulator
MNERRDARLIAAALEIAERDGFAALSRAKVAARAGMKPSTVSMAHGGMGAFYDLVMGAAVKERRLRIIAQGLALGNRIARNAPDDLKRAALASLDA